MSHESTPSHSTDDFVPLVKHEAQPRKSRLRERLSRLTENFSERSSAAAERINYLSLKGAMAGYDAREWVADKAETVVERARPTFRAIGHAALIGRELGIMAGKEAASFAKTTGVNTVRVMRRSAEAGRDVIMNGYDKTKVGIGKAALAAVELHAWHKESQSRRRDQAAIRAYNKILSSPSAPRHSIDINRNIRAQYGNHLTR